MADTFDPYFNWLGIPKDKRPIHYYQLLGLKEFTDDADVIESSVNRQTAHVRSFVDGEHTDLAQALLDQLEQARVCLLNPDRKAAYDKGLRVKLAANRPKTAKPLPKAAPASERPLAKQPNSRRPAATQTAAPGQPVAPIALPARQPRKGLLPKVAIALVLIAAGVGIFAARFWPAGDDVANDDDSRRRAKVVNVTPTNDGPTSPPKTDGSAEETNGNDTTGNDTSGPADLKPDQPGQATVNPPDDPSLEPGPSAIVGTTIDNVVDPPNEPTNPAVVKSSDPPGPDGSPTQPVQDPPPPPQEIVADQRLPVPDADAEKATISVVREIYDDELAESQTPEQKVKLALAMLAAGRSTKNDTAGRYVLFRLSRDLAAEAGDLSLALQAIEQLDADFQIETWPMRAAVVTEIVKQVRGRDEMKAAADEMVALAERALEEDEFEVVETLVDHAFAIARRLRGETELVKGIATFKKRAAERAKRVRAKDAAVAKLKDEPNNADAHLTVGTYLCFYQRDWQHGLPHLAQGSNADLRAVAEKELVAADGEDELLALADAWWDVAAKADDGVNDLMLARAGYWYEKALPDAKALNRIKAERRLAEIGQRLAAQGIAVANPSGNGSRNAAVRQVLYLDDLDEINFSVGYGQVGKHGKMGLGQNAAGDGAPILKFREKQPPHSVSTHPPNQGSTFVEYDIGEKFHLLIGMAAFCDKFDPTLRRASDLTFRVIGDGKLLWRSWPMRLDGQHFRVNVSGVRRLRLQIDCPGSNANAWAAWIMPRLVQLKTQPRGDGVFDGVHRTLHYPLKSHPEGATALDGHWYLYVPGKQINWHSAQRWCEEHGGYLACLETASEDAFVARLAGRREVWLGGTRYGDVWRWISGSPMEFTRWGPNEPNNLEGQESKVQMSYTGRWNDSGDDSSFVKGFVCEWEN